MKIKKFFLIGALAMASLASTSAVFAQQGGVAIVDVDAVARELGIDKEVEESLKKAQDTLNTKLKEAQAAMQKQFDEAVAKAGGDKASNEQKQQLAQYNQQLQNQFNQYQGQARTTLSREQIKLVSVFRDRVSPVALEVAKSKGLGVVMQKSDQILGFLESVDITKEVTAKLKAQAPAAPKASPADTTKASPVKEGAKK